MSSAKRTRHAARQTAEDAAKTFLVHLLDVGREKYGDAILCRMGDVSVLIDGAHPGNTKSEPRHPSIAEQLGELLEVEAPYEIDLLIVSHAHEDHIGCLPALVKAGVLHAKWALVVDPDFGWGIGADDTSRLDGLDPRVRRLVAALREERRPEAPDADIATMTADAASLENNYRAMLATLKANGTKVIRHQRDSVTPLEKAFKAVGLSVLGPSQAQVLRCAEAIARATDAAITQAEALFDQDASIDPVEAYRQLAAPAGDDEADAGRPGAAINLQSIAVRFEYRGKKVLFAGDMQFSKPGVADAEVKKEVLVLRETVRRDGPFAFAKLSHHGAQNAVDEDLLDKMSAPVLGMCGGEEGADHPNALVLGFLKKRLGEGVRWARTDRNGLSTITLGDDDASIEVTRGKINDTRPPDADTIGPSAAITGTVASTASRVPAEAGHSSRVDADIVEIVARIPRRPTRVVVTIDVEPRGVDVNRTTYESRRSDRKPSVPTGRATGGSLLLGGGRRLPKLLFVTSRDALSENVGENECNQILEGLRMTNAEVFDDLPRARKSSEITRSVQGRLRDLGDKVEGVVIVGGHDVVPSQRLDCLSPELRGRLKRPIRDQDDFIVWSDDVYGDQDGDGLPELPVSRIPDGRSAQLVFAALQAKDERIDGGRCGVRNVERPFAEGIFGGLPGANTLRVSEPTETQEGFSLDSDLVYLMLHGDYHDLSVFSGEPDGIAAVTVANVPSRVGRVVFTGCCWGALSVDTPAKYATDGQPIAPRTPEASIALSFLARGTTAFVGCTGVHYSPIVPPYNFYGGPMHDAFWRTYLKGAPPARALFEAKIEYLRGIPHKTAAAGDEAIERKILREYTCLGLGW